MTTGSDRAQASAELDRQYSLETVGYLRTWDNVDGVFSDFVAEAYQEFFTKESRFTWVDLSSADALIGKSKLDYGKLLKDPAVVQKIARSLRVECVLRTQIFKEGPRYRFLIEWVHAPRGEVLASETFTVDEPRTFSQGQSGGGKLTGAIREELPAGLRRLLERLPFKGSVTGRDQTLLTLNLGSGSGLQVGDQVGIATLDEVKRHPLLKQIVEWRLKGLGTCEVEELEEGISFCRVLEEDRVKPLARFHKIVQISHRSKGRGGQPDPLASPIVEGTPDGTVAQAYTQPKLGWAAAGLWMGGIGRNFTATAAAGGTQLSGSTFMFGAKAESQLWLNRNWFVEGALGFGLGTGFGQSDASGNTVGTSASLMLSQMRLDVGYTYFVTPDFFGPKAWVRGGYLTTSYSHAIDTTNKLAPISFGGVFLGVGGELPIRGRLGGFMSVDFAVLHSASSTSLTSNAVSSSNSVDLVAGAVYRYRPRLALRVGFEVLSHAADFEGGLSVNERMIAVLPSIEFGF